jgi:hypothetical protein
MKYETNEWEIVYINDMAAKVAHGEADAVDLIRLVRLFDINPDYMQMFDERRFLMWCIKITGHKQKD